MTCVYPESCVDYEDEVAKVNRLEKENEQLRQEIKRLQGNFTHFHICNHVDDACALCGLAVENEVHLRSR